MNFPIKIDNKIEQQWTKSELTNRLKGLIAHQKKRGWIRADLSVSRSNCLTRLVWHLVAKHFDWMRKLLYKVDLKQSSAILSQLNSQILQANHSDLCHLFSQAVHQYNQISNKAEHQAPILFMPPPPAPSKPSSPIEGNPEAHSVGKSIEEQAKDFCQPSKPPEFKLKLIDQIFTTIGCIEPRVEDQILAYLEPFSFAQIAATSKSLKVAVDRLFVYPIERLLSHLRHICKSDRDRVYLRGIEVRLGHIGTLEDVSHMSVNEHEKQTLTGYWYQLKARQESSESEKLILFTKQLVLKGKGRDAIKAIQRMALSKNKNFFNHLRYVRTLMVGIGLDDKESLKNSMKHVVPFLKSKTKFHELVEAGYTYFALGEATIASEFYTLAQAAFTQEEILESKPIISQTLKNLAAFHQVNINDHVGAKLSLQKHYQLESQDKAEDLEKFKKFVEIAENYQKIGEKEDARLVIIAAKDLLMTISLDQIKTLSEDFSTFSCRCFFITIELLIQMDECEKAREVINRFENELVSRRFSRYIHCFSQLGTIEQLQEALKKYVAAVKEVHGSGANFEIQPMHLKLCDFYDEYKDSKTYPLILNTLREVVSTTETLDLNEKMDVLLHIEKKQYAVGDRSNGLRTLDILYPLAQRLSTDDAKPHGPQQVLARMATYQLEADQREEARQTMLTATADLSHTSDFLADAKCRLEIALVYFKLKDFELAYECFNQAYDIIQKHENFADRLSFFSEAIDELIKLNGTAQAKHAANLALGQALNHQVEPSLSSEETVRSYLKVIQPHYLSLARHLNTLQRSVEGITLLTHWSTQYPLRSDMQPYERRWALCEFEELLDGHIALNDAKGMEPFLIRGESWLEETQVRAKQPFHSLIIAIHPSRYCLTSEGINNLCDPIILLMEEFYGLTGLFSRQKTLVKQIQKDPDAFILKLSQIPLLSLKIAAMHIAFTELIKIHPVKAREILAKFQELTLAILETNPLRNEACLMIAELYVSINEYQKAEEFVLKLPLPQRSAGIVRLIEKAAKTRIIRA